MAGGDPASSRIAFDPVSQTHDQRADRRIERLAERFGGDGAGGQSDWQGAAERQDSETLSNFELSLRLRADGGGEGDCSVNPVEPRSGCHLDLGDTPGLRVFLQVLRGRVGIIHEKVEDSAGFQLTQRLPAEIAGGEKRGLTEGFRGTAPHACHGCHLKLWVSIRRGGTVDCHTGDLDGRWKVRLEEKTRLQPLPGSPPGNGATVEGETRLPRVWKSGKTPSCRPDLPATVPDPGLRDAPIPGVPLAGADSSVIWRSRTVTSAQE